MLNAKGLSELLSKNSDERLCKRWHIMTPNGTLLAYTQPADMRSLRRQAAMAAISWQEHTPGRASEEALASNGVKQSAQLHTLIIESETSNILIRQIRPQLLLVLEGGVPPRKRSFEPRVTAEGPDGEPLHNSMISANADSSLGTSMSSRADSSVSVASGGVLALHRRKLEAMASAIIADFQKTGFKMPEDNINHLF
ncbi:hypothetical protein EJ03DRAFT_16884 [Teratosphaeria nubilosa]|uniref:Uncharacterized protein n=1 Tax=Teratosphaeria nubilosa TaxID=161662 RepID=A0A6G1KVW2_9PEZI|nr:hypothetical protein EJ03DRAFT_16884 [Teratosphaeria nubilosa]